MSSEPRFVGHHSSSGVSADVSKKKAEEEVSKAADKADSNGH